MRSKSFTKFTVGDLVWPSVEWLEADATFRGCPGTTPALVIKRQIADAYSSLLDGETSEHQYVVLIEDEMFHINERHCFEYSGDQIQLRPALLRLNPTRKFF